MRLLISLLLIVSGSAFGHGQLDPAPDAERAISFPDVDGYKTLTVDLHTHSAFSDGHVWPQIRVSEADRDGLDALAVTEHLEWQPHLADIPHPDRNRAFQVTADAAKDLELLIIPGAEITREAPAGHMNAVFITDANALYRAPNPPEDASDMTGYYLHAGEWPAQDAVDAANEQGAFVFWNHPFWQGQQPNGIAEINDFHKKNARNGLLHGIEVANGIAYSEEAYAIALKHDLTLIGVSDVHNLIDWDYPPHEGAHRPVTLVFAKERSLDAIREALFEQRTVVWFKNLLLGRKDEIAALLDASLDISSVGYFGTTDILQVRVANNSDARFILENDSGLTHVRDHDIIEVPANGEVVIGFKPGKKVDSLKLKFKVLNALTAPKKPATLSTEVTVEMPE